MTELALIKSAGGILVPLAANDEAFISEKLKLDEVIRGEFKKARNGKFHRKYMSLLNMGFEYFEPEQHKAKVDSS